MDIEAIRVHAPGGPEAMVLERVVLAEPAAGQVRVRHTAIGLNYIDTYVRAGLYPAPMPITLGMEAAGIVEAVGEGVSALKPGMRVAYQGVMGSYASHANIPAGRALILPDEVSDETAAALTLKGLTAWMLLFEIARTAPGDEVLVWAAAGGVGAALVPWARALGARVIGVVSSAEKAAIAKGYGCNAVILSSEDVAARVRELTEGRGVKTSFDGVGKTSAEASLKSLMPRGLFISFGNASGPVDPIAPLRLSQGGSLFMTRPTLFHYTATDADLARGAAALFGAIASDTLKADIGQRFALKDAAMAHSALEARRTVGASLLLP
jgi:NADPH:quinone reductase